jgi:hypothetical protein
LFARYLIGQFKARWPTSLMYQQSNVQAAIAFFIYIGGETVWRGFVWANHGDVVISLTWMAGLMILGGMISLVGAICCVRVLLPQTWGWQIWALIIAFAAACAIISFLF